MAALLCFLLFLLSAFPAAAQTKGVRMKLVFPIGETVITGKVCQPQHQTNSGCCEPPKEIYTYAPGATACCASPNTIEGTAPNERCCTPLPADQIRWNQSSDNVCGQYITCGTGAIPNAEQNACVCDTGNGYSGTWQKDEGSGNGCVPVDCQGIMLAAGYNTANFTVSGNTVTYTGQMTVSQDLDLTSCHLVVSTDSGYGLYISSGKTLKADSVKGTSPGAGGYGIFNTSGTIIAETVTGNGKTYGIRNSGGVIKAGIVAGEGETNGVQNGGTINAETITGKGQYGVYNSGMIEAESIKGNGTEQGISNTSGTIMAKTLTGNGKTHGIYNTGTNPLIVAETATGTATEANGYGIDNSDGTIEVGILIGENSTGYGIRNSRSGIIKVKTSIAGKGGSCGISNASSTIEVEGIMTGEGKNYGVLNAGGGQISAATVIGKGTDSNETYGIYNSSTSAKITATTVAGEGGTYGVSCNAGTIEAQTVAGQGELYGIYNTNNGTINAESFVTGTGIGASSQGIYNPNGTIKAGTIYYCPKTGGTGTFIGTKTCKPGCTCTN